MARTDFSSVQKAIQDAFDTFWRVREGREQRGENEKQRQAMMMLQQMQERGATERTGMGIASAEKIAGGELGLGKEKLGEEIRSNKEREKILWAEIQAKLKEGKTAEAMTMMVAAATEASKTISAAQTAYRNQDWASLTAMDEFNDRDVESLKKLQPQYAIPLIIEKIQKYSIKKWEPIYKPEGKPLFDYASYLKSLTPANVPKVPTEELLPEPGATKSLSGEFQPTEKQKGMLPRYQPSIIQQPPSFWQNFMNRFKK